MWQDVSDCELHRVLGKALSKRCLFVGVGNESRGDDGFGPFCARLLRRKGFEAIDAGEVPENYTSVIARARPEIVVFIDAAEFRGAPGQLRVFPADDLPTTDFGSHAGSLSLVAKFLKERCGCQVHAICAQTSGSSEAMSDELRRAAEELVGLVSKLSEERRP